MNNPSPKKEEQGSFAKRITLPVAVGVAILGCVLAVSANVTTSQMHGSLQKERYHRLVTEQQLQQTQSQMHQILMELAASRAKIDGIEKIINQGQSNSQELRGQLEALAQERDALKKQIQTLGGQAAANQPPENP